MEYILNVKKIIPLTKEEIENREKNNRYQATYPGGVGMDYDVRSIEVLNVVLTEEEYNRAKSSIINDKK